MSFNALSTYVLAFASIVLGAFLGALGNKLIFEKDNSKWIWAFYIIGAVAIANSIILLLIKLFSSNETNSIGILSIIISFFAGVIIIIYTKWQIHIKNIFTTDELDPIINKFTEIADTNEIKLFGGDLNFFGDNANQINENAQYTKLRSLNFKKVSIICEKPSQNDTTTKIRYGKIISEIPTAELRFYDPKEADLRIRGRISQVNGVNKLLMFTKIRHKRYKAIETDTASSYGALYSNIWELVWSLAIRPSTSDLTSYKSLFSGL